MGPLDIVPGQVPLGRIPGPGPLPRLQCPAMWPRSLHDKRERQDHLWRQFFLDPTLWLDYRQDKKTSRFPDFRHKVSNEVLWLNNVYKPAWVESQLATWDTQMGVGVDESPASTYSSTLPCVPGPYTIAGYEGDVTVEACSKLCKEGQITTAVEALDLLVETGSRVSTFVVYDVLKACLARKNLALGQRVHALTIRLGYESVTFLANHIIRMYASHGRLQEAMDVFTRVGKPDAFMWSSIILAHTEQGEHNQAIQLYHQMSRSSVKPDSHVFVAALKACARASNLESGRQVHADILKSGVQHNVFVGNCMVDMYAKCGRLDDARRFFDSLATRDVVTWTAMIAGYAENGLGQEALSLYARMDQEGVIVADTVTFACLLKVCASVGAIRQGKQLHSEILRRGLEADVLVGSCLVDMYARCGSLEDAQKVFSRLPKRDVITWTAMLNGFGLCNEGQKAIECFQQMLQDAVQPDETTFTCLLVACSHEGLVNDGRQYFNAMVKDHNIVPTKQHYVCMVDLLGRSGHLDEAEETLLLMPFESNVVGWTSLLNACKSYGDLERGRRCFESLIRLEPENASAYVLMASIYALAGRWTDVHRLERLRKSVGATKKPAKAGIEVNRQVHTFVVGEERDDISLKLRSMEVRLKEGGHVPHTELVLKAVSEEEKEDELCGHAEKLALAYGLLKTSDGTPLLVTKNLRMCGDCHSATEVMSRIEQRKIIVRDAHRVHRFINGACSCGDRP